MKLFSFKSLFGRSKQVKEEKSSSPSLGATILIVDDSTTIRTILRKMLHQAEYNTLEAEDGEAAVEMVHSHKPDLVLMDVVMPGMTGFQATRRLHKHPATKDIPIIIMSGNEQAIEAFWVNRIGARDFMTKPFDRKDVLQRIEKILHAEVVQ